MLGRIADDIERMKSHHSDRSDIDRFLQSCGDPGYADTNSLWDASAMVAKCRLKKVGGKLFTTDIKSKL